MRQVGSGYLPSVSRDGRYIAYYAGAAVSVFDRESGTTTLASVATIYNVNSRYVLFESSATNLVAGDTNAHRDIFRRDTETGTTIRLSGNSADGGATAGNYAGALTPDGGAAVSYSELP